MGFPPFLFPVWSECSPPQVGDVPSNDWRKTVSHPPPVLPPLRHLASVRSPTSVFVDVVFAVRSPPSLNTFPPLDPTHQKNQTTQQKTPTSPGPCDMHMFLDSHGVTAGGFVFVS